MADLPLVAFGFAIGGLLYTYIGYPAVLAVLAWARPWRVSAREPHEWPFVTVLIPAHNEARAIGDKLDNVLQLDYPRSRLHVLVVSDASTDDTDSIVQSYADRCVELVRLHERGGKTAAQNRAIPHVRGDIVVNTDASALLDSSALKGVVKPFLADGTIGVVSGRVISLMNEGRDEETGGESWYLGYDMAVRLLETRTGSTVGATGALYAVRRELFREYPGHLCRDFGSCLIAREHGLRVTLESTAKCYIGASGSLAAEYRRKVRTLTNGMQTLFHHVSLLNPFSYGGYALKLLSHKLARWLTPPLLLIALISSLWLDGPASLRAAAMVLWLGVVLSTAAAMIRSRYSTRGVVAGLGYLGVWTLAVGAAWRNVITGIATPIWDPTRRKVAKLSS